jgi:hypothetical protein
MTGILDLISNNQPSDQLFLHLDRNLYYTGDTIRFKAYIRDRQTGIFETKSISLYSLLLNSDHVTVDSARFRINYSTASGWLKVPETIPPGDYSILAFTSDQMNYSPDFAFRTPVRVGINGLDQNHNDTIIPRSQTSFDLRFLPEGGTFISGISQRLAFNAVTPDGRILKVSGVIINQKGDKIVEFKSGPYGPGVVEFTPVDGETYYAKTAENEYWNLRWPLPEPEKSGVTLRVNNAGPGLIDLILKRRATGEKEYFLAVTMNNILIFSENITLDTLFKARIKTDEIPSGTAIVTLYDNELYPHAERMIFLNDHKKMNIRIDASPEKVSPGNETELAINTTDEKGNNISSIVSLSVIDSLSGYHSMIPLPDIESAFLYDMEFYNNLPRSIRCIGLSNFDSKSIDLLMMTYGWRKYTLKEAELVAQVKRSENYDQLKIRNPGPVKRGRKEVNIISPEVGRAITLGINSNREAILPYDSLEADIRQIVILPDDNLSRNANPVIIDFPKNKEYTEKAKLIITDSIYPFMDTATVEVDQHLYNPDNPVVIESVTIKGQRKSTDFYADKNAEQYRIVGTTTLTEKDFANDNTFEDIIYKLGAFRVDRRIKQIALRPIQRFGILSYKPVGEGYAPALFVVDNVPITDRTYTPIATLPLAEVESVTVLRGYEGFARFGSLAFGGVIFITTKKGKAIINRIPEEDKKEKNDNHIEYIRVFRTEVEYYIPTKEEVDLVPEYKFRSVVLWKDDVLIDGSGPAKIRYPNNLVKGTVMVIVNGVSFTNLIGSNRKSYNVK